MLFRVSRRVLAMLVLLYPAKWPVHTSTRWKRARGAPCSRWESGGRASAARCPVRPRPNLEPPAAVGATRAATWAMRAASAPGFPKVRGRTRSDSQFPATKARPSASTTWWSAITIRSPTGGWSIRPPRPVSRRHPKQPRWRVRRRHTWRAIYGARGSPDGRKTGTRIGLGVFGTGLTQRQQRLRQCPGGQGDAPGGSGGRHGGYAARAQPGGDGFGRQSSLPASGAHRRTDHAALLGKPRVSLLNGDRGQGDDGEVADRGALAHVFGVPDFCGHRSGGEGRRHTACDSRNGRRKTAVPASRGAAGIPPGDAQSPESVACQFSLYM